MKLLKENRFSGGYSFIELLVVILIVGLLYFGFLLTSQTQIQKGRDSRRKVDMDVIRRGLEEYYDSRNCYPDPSVLPVCKSPFILGESVLIKAMPCDPATKLPYVYVTDGTSCSSWFQIYTKLEHTSDPIIETLGCLDHGCGPSCLYNFGVSSTNKSLDICS